MGPPHGEESALDIRIEGFNTPWLHAKDRLKRRFLVWLVKIIFLSHNCIKIQRPQHLSMKGPERTICPSLTHQRKDLRPGVQIVRNSDERALPKEVNSPFQGLLRPETARVVPILIEVFVRSGFNSGIVLVDSARWNHDDVGRAAIRIGNRAYQDGDDLTTTAADDRRS